MNEPDYKRIVDFYESSFLLYGNDARSVHWSNEGVQNIRFEVLANIADLENRRVLDVGCGLGDLYKFFLKKEINVDYVGIDVVPIFIDRARTRFPEGNFILANAENMTDEYDYILASGSFSFTVEHAQEYYFEMIKNLFTYAHFGFAFNMLNKEAHQSDDTYITYDINEVITFCKTLTPYVTIIDNYLPWDFTVYMYKR